MNDGVHTDAWCRANSKPAAVAMQAHSAPLGVDFFIRSKLNASVAANACPGGSPAAAGGFPASMVGAGASMNWFGPAAQKDVWYRILEGVDYKWFQMCLPNL